MNIYLDVETAVRELDSKILLGVLAASKGHEIIISHKTEILRGMKSGILSPGVFHNKSLTPSKDRIAISQSFIDKGFIITAIDEEGGLVDHGYKPATYRFSNISVEQASAIFTWGPEDTETLKKVYSKNSSKIFMTGSPRADLWKTFFSDYWSTPNGAPNRNFLLVSSNFGLANNPRYFHKMFKMYKKLGMYERDPDLMDKHFGIISENYQNMYEFIKGIKQLSKINKFDIVVRPHPAENIEPWKVFLDGFPNVHIIREGSITPWLKESFAVLHNGCTTALEATFSKKPILTFIPFKHKFSREVANELGFIVKSVEELIDKVNVIFNAKKSNDSKESSNQLPEVLTKKIYFDENELAAMKMIKVWESLSTQKLSKSTNWLKFRFLLIIMSVRDNIAKVLKKLLPYIFGFYEENHKFPPLNKEDILKKIDSFQKILGIKDKIELKFLSERTILLKCIKKDE